MSDLPLKTFSNTPQVDDMIGKSDVLFGVNEGGGEGTVEDSGSFKIRTKKKFHKDHLH